MDLNPLRITPLPGAVSIPFVEDFLIEVCFRDSATGAVVLDCTGEHGVKVSELLASLPTEVLAAFVNETAVKMVMVAKGLT
ncbi:hypothetical protein [Paludisphaera borealis]|uniref:Uncharacterized protein n=1 Tax=Paludisphaera borealis TaxID=1387353 RepID=A0A1U7CNG9_9BACT|nr:hypothetical protein [Paludisphaera borealis]APW60482.1 hypothetical protein BSF38_01952 [Paludisphaera borealis]